MREHALHLLARRARRRRRRGRTRGPAPRAIARTRAARAGPSSSSGIHSSSRCTRLPKSRPPVLATAATGGGAPARARGASPRRARYGRSAARATSSRARALPARGHARRRPRRSTSAHSSRPRPGVSGRGSVSASTTRTSASPVGGQRVDQLLPEAADRGVDRRARHDQQVARARAGDVEQPPRLGARLLLVLAHEHVPAGRLAAAAEADRDLALVPERHGVDRRVGVVVGVEERHHRRLEALGLVDRQHAHGVGVARPRRGQVGLLARVLDAVLRAGSRSRAA